MSNPQTPKTLDRAASSEPQAESRRYEPPRITELGTLAELTHGTASPGFDDNEVGST